MIVSELTPKFGSVKYQDNRHRLYVNPAAIEG